MSGFQHQCRTPWIWWTRLIGSRVGREWCCPTCSLVWTLGYMRFPMIPGAPLIHEWKVAR